MALGAGVRLGPYEILSPLGAGGMGEVYKARDTRLDRTVAIKVLPKHIASRDDARARFEREARAVASLNHPHICVLHDIGSQDGTGFLVLEHLDGETLAARIAKGALPLDLTLKLAIQIADALDRAHRKGVCHRDIKPANIMLTRDGAKILDFGLAKTTASKTTESDATLTAALTGEGTVLGTPHYMAPEQYEGKEADTRCDIFAFGCVLYEMITGRRAFDGKTKASVIAAVLGADPPSIAAAQPVTPSQLDRLVTRCLAKDPEDRWQSMRDILLELHSIQPNGDAVSPKGRQQRWLWPAVAALMLTAGISAGWFARRPELPHSYRYNITPPDNVSMIFYVSGGGMDLSPDGSMLAFVGRREGIQQLWLRRLDSLENHPLEGTEGARYPFWSPDSKSLAFFANGKLKRVDVSGGLPRTLCGAADARGGTWSPQGVILIGGGHAIVQVPDSGGTPVAVTTSDAARPQSSLHITPSFLPDGRHFLYLAGPENAAVFLATIDSPGPGQRILTSSSPARYVPALPAFSSPAPGFLLYRMDSSVIARPFNPNNLALAGEAVSLGEGFWATAASMVFSAAPGGMLAYESGSSSQHLIWRDRTGKVTATAAGPAIYGSPALAPDSERLTFGRNDAGIWDLWIQDLKRATVSRFTFTDDLDAYNLWSPTGDRVAFSVPYAGEVFIKASSGAGQPAAIANVQLATPYDWSGDGEFLLIGHASQAHTGSANSAPDRDVSVLSLRDRKLQPLLTTPFSELHTRFAPNPSGAPRWIAYDSDEGGIRQVYVQPFTPGQPASGVRWQLSTSGGVEPRWRADGKELFYLSPDEKMMSVSVKTDGAVFEAGSPVALFATPAAPSTPVGWSYDITRDGNRFLLMEPSGASQAITIVTNWQAALQR